MVLGIVMQSMPVYAADTEASAKSRSAQVAVKGRVDPVKAKGKGAPAGANAHSSQSFERFRKVKVGWDILQDPQIVRGIG